MNIPCYAVFGNPVAHSQSPQIHQNFALQEGVQIEYKRILVELGQFNSAADYFFSHGGLGANVTLPFKTDAYHWVHEHSERAKIAEAVNTLIPLADGHFMGDNTDGIGLVNDIVQAKGVFLRNKKILLIGAGGAVRGVLQSLLMEQPAELVLTNRTISKANLLAQHFDVKAMAFSELPKCYFDVIINATSGGLSGQLPEVDGTIFANCELAYDMVYGEPAQQFLAFAKKSGAHKVVDGFGMLVGQAAASYALWRGFSPDISAVIHHMAQANQ